MESNVRPHSEANCAGLGLELEKDTQDKYKTFAAVAAEDIVYVMLLTLPLPEVKRILEVAKNINEPDMQINKIAKELVIEYCDSRRLLLESVLAAMFDNKDTAFVEELNDKKARLDGSFTREDPAGNFVFQDTADVLETFADAEENMVVVPGQEGKE